VQHDPADGVHQVPPGRVDGGLEAGAAEVEFVAQRRHREFGVPQQVRVGAVGGRDEVPPRSVADGQPQRQFVRRGTEVAGDHLGLAGERGEHPGVRGEQDRAHRDGQFVGPLAHRRGQRGGHGHLMLGDAFGGVVGRPAGRDPPRDRGGPARGEHATPELAARAVRRWHFHRRCPPRHC
jgi:hypothetical protein